MTPKSCPKVYHKTLKACQVYQPGSLADLAGVPGPGQPGTLVRAERTPGAVAVSGICGEGSGKGNSFPDFPKTNSKPFVNSEGFFINEPGPFEGCQDAGGGSWPGPAGDLAGLILDSVAKRSGAYFAGLEKDCPAGVITGSCANGHRFAKEVYCGREWCPVCNGKWEKGKAMLPTHARRFARWYPKAQQFDGLGYWTFTIPQELRAKFRTQKALGELGKAIVKLLRSYGYSRGLRRWHYFGDRSQDWHPHLNCLVDGGHLDKKALRSLRREYSRLLGVKLAIADYHYWASPGEKVHALTYVTRATFLDWTWDADMARELKGFRNQLWWGSKQWDRQPVWSLDDLSGELPAAMSDTDTRAVAGLENGECPRCGLPISWERFLPIRVLPELGGRNIGAGYWELPYVRPPPYRLDFAELEMVRYWRGLIREATGAERSIPGVSDTRNDRFIARHRSFVQAKISWLEQAEGDRALWSEVLEPAEKSFEYRGSPGSSGGPGIAVRKPNCLGGVSLEGKI